MLSVSIVIPAYNEEKYIGRLLVSLQKLPPENILEIIVVDNGSTDKTPEIVRGFAKTQPSLRLVEESRKGVMWARSRCAQESSGDVIIFLDADTFVSERWLEIILRFFDSPKIVAVSGPTYYDDMPKFSEFSAFVYWWFISIFVYRFLGYMGNFANFAIRKHSLEKIGGIDTKVEFYGDDTNIARRLSKVGKVLFTPKVWIYASGRRFNREGLIRTAFRYAVNFFAEVILHKPVTKGYTEVR